MEVSFGCAPARGMERPIFLKGTPFRKMEVPFGYEGDEDDHRVLDKGEPFQIPGADKQLSAHPDNFRYSHIVGMPGIELLATLRSKNPRFSVLSDTGNYRFPTPSRVQIPVP